MYKTLLFAFIMLATIACNNDNSTQNASINTNNESTVLTQQSSNTENTVSPPQHNYEDGTYTWSKHDDPRIFFADFQKALKNRDQEAVFQMINIPLECQSFICLARQQLSPEEFDLQFAEFKNYPNLSIRNKKEFYEKYDFLFSTKTMKAIFNDSVITFNEIFQDIKKNHPQEIEDYESYEGNNTFIISGDLILLSFELYNNKKYKLAHIPYDP